MSFPLRLSVDAVADRAEAAEIQLVDVREPWEYDAIGHLPGAVNIPFDRFRDAQSDEPGTLPGAAVFRSLLSEAGISPEKPIVAYDDMHGVFASRFVLTAIVYGYDSVGILDGDFTAWQRSHPIDRDTPTKNKTEGSLPTPPPASPIVSTDTVQSLLAETDTTFIDTREQDEYADGHLQGAIRLDWMELVDPDTRGGKPEQEIESILIEHGIPTERSTPIVLYCNTARRLSHTYLLLRSIGFENVKIYEGSLAAWDGPLEQTNS